MRNAVQVPRKLAQTGGLELAQAFVTLAVSSVSVAAADEASVADAAKETKHYVDPKLIEHLESARADHKGYRDLGADDIALLARVRVLSDLNEELEKLFDEKCHLFKAPKATPVIEYPNEVVDVAEGLAGALNAKQEPEAAAVAAVQQAASQFLKTDEFKFVDFSKLPENELSQKVRDFAEQLDLTHKRQQIGQLFEQAKSEWAPCTDIKENQREAACRALGVEQFIQKPNVGLHYFEEMIKDAKVYKQFAPMFGFHLSAEDAAKSAAEAVATETASA